MEFAGHLSFIIQILPSNMAGHFQRNRCEISIYEKLLLSTIVLFVANQLAVAELRIPSSAFEMD